MVRDGKGEEESWWWWIRWASGGKEEVMDAYGGE